MSKTVTCPECGAPMALRSTPRFTHRYGSPRKFYGCSRFPACRATHGAHPDGRPLGTPADPKTKAARVAAHNAFDRLWRRELGGTMKRKNAYRLRRALMGMTEDEAHVGKFGREQCAELVRRLNDPDAVRAAKRVIQEQYRPMPGEVV